MKNLKMIFLAFFVFFIVTGFTRADATIQREPYVLQKTIYISLDGKSSEPQDVLFLNSLIYAPIGVIAKKLDCNLDWNSEQQQLLITKKPMLQDFEEATPQQGERFVYGEVMSIDLKNRLLTIEEHYDDQYIHSEPDLFVLPDVIIILQRNKKGMNLDFEDLKIGDVVGIVLNKDEKIRGIILNQ